MKKINVIEHTTGNGFHIDFLNGSAEIPDTYGGYCISCGFGAGKTSSIRQLIRLKYNQGIIYCVDTVKELEKMYNNILSDIASGLMPGLDKDDIICLRGHRNEKDGADMEYNGQLKEYRSDPSMICKKKIILLTHCRFFSELIQYFLIYSESPITTTSLGTFDGNFQKLMSMNEVRKYIIFDETPNMFRPLIKIPKTLMYAMTMDKKDPNGRRLFHPNPLEQYDMLVKGTAWDLFKGGSPFAKQKKYAILSSLPKLWPDWETDSKMEFSMHYYPSDLIQKNMKCHVLLYEGVADVLLNDSKDFSLIDLPQKYNSKVNCNIFPFNCKRNDKFSPDTITHYVEILESILSKTTGRTLIVVWKGICGVTSDKVDCSPFRDALKEQLTKDGYTGFSITYYGASDCKSTNDYQDYGNIILLGDWCIDVKDLQTTREAYSSGVGVDRWKFYYFIQTIGRIGIRQHNGGEYNAFFSSDFEPGFIEMVREYLNNNVSYTKPKKKVDVFESVVKKLKETKHREYLRSLADYDLSLRQAIESGKQYTITIPFDDLKRLCPKKGHPKPSDYRYFGRALFSASGVKLRTLDNHSVVKELYAC